MKFLEKEINYNAHTHLYKIAAQLCTNENEYCLYEYDTEDIAVGLGCYAEIKVKDNKIFVKKENKSQVYDIHNFSEDVDNIFKSLNLESWRAYGIAGFGLARYTYGLDKGMEGDELIRFIIPRKEFSLKKDKVLISALKEEDLEVMEKKFTEAVKNADVEIKGNILDPEKVLSYDEDYYKSIVNKGTKEIKDKKFQKVILSRKVPLNSRLDMLKTYIKGRSANTPARSYIYKLGSLEIAGFSPETVAEVDGNRNVYTFPLAGTRALTDNLDENRRLKDELLHDTKEIAEHAVSVKLADEEMHQVCEENSVVVTQFMSIMERGTVQHLGSRLRGKLKDELNPWHAFCKLFPAVTASGIPKKESIDAIGRIEKEGRGLYSGSVLTYDSNGVLDAALVLRSIFQTRDETWVRVGAGIVEMSKPEREFTETQEKVSSIAKELVLAEDN